MMVPVAAAHLILMWVATMTFEIARYQYDCFMKRSGGEWRWRMRWEMGGEMDQAQTNVCRLYDAKKQFFQ